MIIKSQLLILFTLFYLSSFTQEKYALNELILKFKTKPQISSDNVYEFNSVLQKLNSDLSLQNYQVIDNNKTFIFRFKNNINIQNTIQKYANTNLFEYVEPNFTCFGAGKKGTVSTFPNEANFNRQWYLYNDGSFNLSPSIADADIDMELAWDIEQGDSNIIVAVLDTGTKLDHPELTNRIWTNTSEQNNGLDDDGNGLIDDVYGWDFANNDNNPIDDVGHGTNIIGIIGANANNGIGYAGMDWNCKLMTCKVLDNSNNGYYSWMIQGIHYAVDNGAKVINMSIGGSSFSSGLQDAVDYAYNNGVTIVACMMNFNNNVTYYPAGFQNTIAVGSTDSNDQRTHPFFWSATSGSNYGNHIDVVAPGNYIYGLNHTSNTNYNTYWGGTSQATPQVVALCSLLLAQDNTRTPNDLRTIIRNTAQDQVGTPNEDTSGFDIYYGYGRINAYDALNYNSLAISNSVNEKFSIFPSLVKNEITIIGDVSDKILTITNTLGQNILTFKEINSNKLNLKDLKKGIYFLTVSDNLNRKIFIKKIIKIY